MSHLFGVLFQTWTALEEVLEIISIGCEVWAIWKKILPNEKTSESWRVVINADSKLNISNNPKVQAIC